MRDTCVHAAVSTTELIWLEADRLGRVVSRCARRRCARSAGDGPLRLVSECGPLSGHLHVRYAHDRRASAGLIIEFVAFLLLCCVALCLMTYAAMAIGQSFKKNKGLMSVVFFFVLWIGTRMLLTLIFGLIFGSAHSRSRP